MPRSKPACRSLLAALVFGVLAAACTKGSPTPGCTNTAVPGSIAALEACVPSAHILSVFVPQGDPSPDPSQIPVGHSQVVVALAQSGGLVQGGSPLIYVSQDKDTRAIGPYVATFHHFAPPSEFNDRTSPRSPITGFYTADLDFRVAGTWFVGAQIRSGSTTLVGDDTITVRDHVDHPVGSKAISVKTPVAHTIHQAEEIDTRRPPDPMHYISLDQALKNGKPTVVVFSTPLLCTSKLCGPVTDEVLLAFQKVGKAKANFIHVEEFLPGPDLLPPPATLANQSPGFKAWHLTTEPWVFVIDSHGIIRGRFEGEVTADMVLAALHPLLGK